MNDKVQKKRFLGFSVAVLAVAVVLAACGSGTGPRPEQAGPRQIAPDVMQDRIRLPWLDEETLVTYQVVDGLAVFEGDIVLGEVSESGTLQTQGAVIEQQGGYRWPGGVIPYEIADGVPYLIEVRISQAIAQWEQSTVIRFVERTSDNAEQYPDYVRFVVGVEPSICLSEAGRQSGMQEIVLGTECGTSARTVSHEIGHAVGLMHEHSRTDRDDRVQVMWGNILDDVGGEDYRYAFCTIDQVWNATYETCVPSSANAEQYRDMGDYDYRSIMHYSKSLFATDDGECNAGALDECTLLPVDDDYTDIIGTLPVLSEGDIATVRRLYPPEATLWHLGQPDMPAGAAPGDRYGDAVAAGDFDGDGRMDLAVGIPLREVDGWNEAGAVNVLYGTPDGLTEEDAQLWDQSDVIGVAEHGARFGAAVASVDFDGDGFDDLVVGAPGMPTQVPGAGYVTSGVVYILRGGNAGLKKDGAQELYLGLLAGGGDLVGDGDGFGSALSPGDFNGDGHTDLAVGAPMDDVDGTPDAGSVTVFFGDGHKPGVEGARYLHQDVLNGRADRWDYFGWALASGDFSADGEDDLAIGIPGKTVGGAVRAGSVLIVNGGPELKPVQLFHQDKPLIEGDAYPNDFYGWSLASGDFNGDGGVDLAVGVPGDYPPDVEPYLSATMGSVNVLYSRRHPRSGMVGLSAYENILFGRWLSAISGNGSAGERYGHALASGDFNGDDLPDLAIGAPRASIINVATTGAVNILWGNEIGLSVVVPTGDQIWLQDRVEAISGVRLEGTPEPQDDFGWALAAGDFNGDGTDDVAVGVPGEDHGDRDLQTSEDLADAGAVNLLYYFD